MKEELLEKAKKIRALILDVDGVLTNGVMYYSNYGEEIKAFDVRDGFAMVVWQNLGNFLAIITAHKSGIVRRRAKDLNIRYIYESRNNKLKVYYKIKRKFKLQDSEICYIGDDLIDLAVIKAAGFSVTVPEAASEVKASVDYITEKAGGSGAVREVIELILKAQGKWHKVLDSFEEIKL